MAGNGVEVEMDALKKKLQKMRDNLSNPSPTMQKVSLLMYKDSLDHFAKQTSDTGAWTPIQYRKGRILQDTGALRNSLQASNTKDSAVVSAGNSSVDYAGYHQYGTKNIPQRKFLWISQTLRDAITRMVGKFSIGESV